MYWKLSDDDWKQAAVNAIYKQTVQNCTGKHENYIAESFANISCLFLKSLVRDNKFMPTDQYVFTQNTKQICLILALAIYSKNESNSTKGK